MVLYSLSFFSSRRKWTPIESASTPPPRISEHWKLLHLSRMLQRRIESQLRNYYDWNKAQNNCRNKSRIVIVKYSVNLWTCNECTDYTHSVINRCVICFIVFEQMKSAIQSSCFPLHERFHFPWTRTYGQMKTYEQHEKEEKKQK